MQTESRAHIDDLFLSVAGTTLALTPRFQELFEQPGGWDVLVSTLFDGPVHTGASTKNREKP
jgi:hypothetical protein